MPSKYNRITWRWHAGHDTVSRVMLVCHEPADMPRTNNGRAVPAAGCQGLMLRLYGWRGTSVFNPHLQTLGQITGDLPYS